MNNAHFLSHRYFITPIKRYRAYTVVHVMRVVVVCLLLINGEIVAANAQECEGYDSAAGTSGYAWRGNRCEGFFSTKKVAGATLDLIGFIKGQFSYALEPNERIRLHLPANLPPEYQSVHVRARPFSWLTYYRMDAVMRRNTTLNWPVKDILLPEHVQARDIRVYGEYLLNSGTGADQVHVIVPLIATSSVTEADNDDVLRLYLRSIENVESVRHIWRCRNHEIYSDTLVGTVWAGRPIIISVPATIGGICVVNIDATIKGRNPDIASNHMKQQLVMELGDE